MSNSWPTNDFSDMHYWNEVYQGTWGDKAAEVGASMELFPDYVPNKWQNGCLELKSGTVFSDRYTNIFIDDP